MVTAIAGHCKKSRYWADMGFLARSDEKATSIRRCALRASSFELSNIKESQIVSDPGIRKCLHHCSQFVNKLAAIQLR